jgi:hypothetical protein
MGNMNSGFGGNYGGGSSFKIRQSNISINDNYPGGFKAPPNQDIDDGGSSAKSKPFRIKDMAGDYMNNTGISTTGSNHTNNTGGPMPASSRRELNDRRIYSNP